MRATLDTAPESSEPRGARPGAAVAPDDSIDLLDVLLVLGRHRRMLVLWPLAVALVTAVASLVMRSTYTAETRILPSQQSQGAAAAMLSQLGGLAGVAGSALGVRSPGDLYVGLLRSRAVADALVERFELPRVYGQKQLVDVRRTLAQSTRIETEKSGLIFIEVDARDPKLAADLANGYVEQLHRLTGTLAVGEAAQRRLFFERQLELTKEKLADLEVGLRGAMEAGGLVSVDAQGRAAVETVARLRAQISAKEIQIRAMDAYATPSNPAIRFAEQEIAAMRQELARLESGTGGTAASAPGGRIGSSGVDNLRLLREVKYQEALYEILAKQYELARVDEARDAPLVQVVDRAQPPERRSKPRRTLMVIVATAAALFLAVVGAFASDAWTASRAEPGRREKLDELREAWWRRSR